LGETGFGLERLYHCEEAIAEAWDGLHITGSVGLVH
jgi:hypothetical protein